MCSSDLKLTDKIEFLSADEEDQYYVAMANTPLEEDGVTIAGDSCPTRHQDDIDTIPVEKVNYMDVSPKQIVSPSTALIPFLTRPLPSNSRLSEIPLLCSFYPKRSF